MIFFMVFIFMGLFRWDFDEFAVAGVPGRVAGSPKQVYDWGRRPHRGSCRAGRVVLKPSRVTFGTLLKCGILPVSAPEREQFVSIEMGSSCDAGVLVNDIPHDAASAGIRFYANSVVGAIDGQR
jgi:hypothetical protein